MSSTFSFSAETYVLVGEVTKAQGLRGELKIRCYSGQPENLINYKSLLMVDRDGNISPDLTVLRCRIQGSSAIVLFATIDDRTAAEQYVGCGVLVAKANMPPPQDGEFYWLDFQGKIVHTTNGRELGKITHLFSNGAQDIMVVSDGQHEYMVPVVAKIVVSVSSEGIVIEPPAGLLELNDSSAGRESDNP